MKQQSKSNSQKIGREISRLIGIAQQVKRKERNESQPAPTYEQISVKRWQETAMKYASEANSLKEELAQARRHKLANFSLQDIEAELKRRLTQIGS